MTGLDKLKVVLTGKSLHRILLAAQESGYMKDIAPLIDERDITRFKRQELLVIATGCQGEDNLNRQASSLCEKHLVFLEAERKSNNQIN